MTDQPRDLPKHMENCAFRWALLAFGWVNVVVGFIGIFVPGLPTTVFLIIAFWAFSRSSERFQTWLWNHPRFGTPIRNWHAHRVIPPKAKILAAVMMTASFAFVCVYVAQSWVMPVLLAAVMVPAAAYVLTRASHVPEDAMEPAPADQGPGPGK